MPVRRGHVAPKNTFLDTIIRKFEGQNRKFIIANARVENCAIIFCNDAFCGMCGYTRAEVMQKPCTCSFLYGPHTKRPAVAQMAKALLGSKERKVDISLYTKDGVCFSCKIDVVPVKNEDGLLIIFILNFELPTDPHIPRSPTREFNHKLPIPWLTLKCRNRFRLRSTLVRPLSRSKQSLENDTKLGHQRDLLTLGHESVALKKLLSPPERRHLGGTGVLHRDEDQRALLGGESILPSTDTSDAPPALSLGFSQSSPRLHCLRMDEECGSNCIVTPSHSCESLCSLRHVSSVDGIKIRRGRASWHGKLQTRPSSTGRMTCMKSSLRNVTSDTTSDPNLIRFRTFSHVTQVNPLEYRPNPLVAHPSAEMDIIAPCKLMDRTHGVTEKFTQIDGTLNSPVWIHSTEKHIACECELTQGRARGCEIGEMSLGG
ncbi:potassium voltage-gated channel subfamily H member 2-like [Oncorhynchus masou masou]|uniref:potassium voltage-gated channel subfamily H member 2-like n=1 Tax=Oncorhynchus masou masou TaxID=90313 RepID=UPI0031833438